VISVWDVATGLKRFGVGRAPSERKYIKDQKKFTDDDGDPAFSAAFSPDGHFIAAGMTGGVRLYEIATGKQVLQVELRSSLAEGTDAIYDLAFSGGGQLLLAAVTKGVHVVDVSTGRHLRTLKCPYAQLAPYPDGHHVLLWGVGSDYVELWDIDSGVPLANLYSFPDHTWAVVAPDGRFDSNNLDGAAALHWLVSDAPLDPLPLEIFMRDYYEPRLLSKLLDGQVLSPVRRVGDLNRVQPEVRIIGVVREPGNEDLATVSIQVRDTEKKQERSGAVGNVKSGAQDLRLCRNHRRWHPSIRLLCSSSRNRPSRWTSFRWPCKSTSGSGRFSRSLAA
jgi:WD40 repeat protein